MITCFPVWTTAAAPVARRITHHIGRRLTRHSIRHAALATVRIVCVSVPAWLAAPTPAAAPPVPDTSALMPPPMLPWPEGEEAPWGWGDYGPLGAAMPILPPSDAPGGAMPAWQSGQGADQPSVVTFINRAGSPASFVDTTEPPHQPVPEPSSGAVLAVGVLVLAALRRGRA